MSIIKMFSLGGLNEVGKNMYILNIDDNIFVFDAGLKYTDESSLGIDYIIPNIEYLKINKNKIKGIFLTHGHDENIGAIVDVYRDLENVKIYASKFTINIIKEEFCNYNLDTSNLVEIKPNKELLFGSIKIFPVTLTHSIPDNFGYSVYTEDGIIFYASDFVFDSTMRGPYQTDIGKLAYIGKQNVLCLLTESLYATKKGHTAPNNRMSNVIRETLNKAEGRIIFNVLNSHLYRIQELFDEVEKTDKKVVIMGKRLQTIIEDALKNNYLNFDKKIIGDLSNINDENVIILNSNEREKPYANLIRIINGYDRYIELKNTDTVFIASPVYEGREKIFYKVLDDLAKCDVNIVTLSDKKYLSHHASSEDLMMMIDLLNPKYYFPVKGEYRHQIANAELAEKIGLNPENIILKQNGDVATIINGKLIESFEHVPVGSVSIDGDSSDDIGEVVLKDREMLSNNGVMIISATLSKTNKSILAGPEILTRGFIYVKDSVDTINEIKEICTKIIKDNIHDNYVEYNKIKNTIREELGKYLFNHMGNKPMIITIMQEI